MGVARTKLRSEEQTKGAMELPRLTFIMPTYNREKTVGSALEQLSLQIVNSRFRSQFTILISENQSTDRTAEIVSHFSARHNFIKVVSPSQHLPSGEHNLFFALGQVDTDFVWSFADDDLMLPGAIDWIYERLINNPADFILINSQYQDADGQVLRDRILDMHEGAIYYDSFGDIFTEVGPLTLLASFSSAIYRPAKVKALDLNSYLSPCAIYAHVFAYLDAFAASRVEIIAAPLVVLRRSTALAHWETVAQRYGWYMYYPWTGGLANHLLRARERKTIRPDQYGFALNSNENGRYGLVANMLVQFMLQLLRALETGDPREVPSRDDFVRMRAVVQDIPYVAIDTLDFLLWAERHFGEVCALLAPPDSLMRLQPSRMADSINNLDFDDSIEPWLGKVRQRLLDKVHATKGLYVNFGTIAAGTRPFTFMAGTKYVIFRLATRFVVMVRELYEQDWRIMQPNCLDPLGRAPDWYIYNTFDEAMKRYVQLDRDGAGINGVADRSNQVLNAAIAAEPWSVLQDALNTGGIQAFVEGVAKSSALRDVRRTIGLILGQTEPREECNVLSVTVARHGFINPVWYRNTYLQRTQGLEREMMQHAPLIHYVLIGSRKGWSLSPFVDEFLLKEAQLGPDVGLKEDTTEEQEITGLARYFSSDGIGEVSEFFSVPYYLEQCKSKGIQVDTAPPVHFLAAGIRLGMKPHPNWDETAYLNSNSDVKHSSDAPCLGWLHWCIYGRFEKRTSGFARRGVK